MCKQNRELTYHIGATFGGFIAGPDHQVEDFPLDADLIGAIQTEWPETSRPDHRDALPRPHRRRHPVVRGPYQPTAFTLDSNRSLESGASIQTYRKA